MDNMTLDEFFKGMEASRPLYEALYAVVKSIGPVEVRVTKSQIAFRRRKAFAWTWVPGKYLRGKVAPLVLTLALTRREDSPRWKQVVEPVHGRFTHHLEIYTTNNIDEEVRDWLREAWMEAD